MLGKPVIWGKLPGVGRTDYCQTLWARQRESLAIWGDPRSFRPDAVDFDSGSGLGDSVTPSILLVLAIVAAAVVLFVTEWVRYDLVALIVLLLLALTGLITSTEAIQGFSNPAVITIAAVLVLSGGLYRTGIAHFVGDHVLRLAGEGAGRLTLLLMVTAGLLSGIMNNIAVSALLIPVVLEISGRTGHAPSKLLIPLAFASLLGGMTTLIGTAPNILISGAAADAGLGAFGMFAYAPVGIAALVAGVAYMALIGRRLLPERRKDGDHRGISSGLWEQFELEETLFSLQLPTGSTLASCSDPAIGSSSKGGAQRSRRPRPGAGSPPRLPPRRRSSSRSRSASWRRRSATELRSSERTSSTPIFGDGFTPRCWLSTAAVS
jgi:hypothetical protein